MCCARTRMSWGYNKRGCAYIDTSSEDIKKGFQILFYVTNKADSVAEASATCDTIAPL